MGQKQSYVKLVETGRCFRFTLNWTYFYDTLFVMYLARSYSRNTVFVKHWCICIFCLLALVWTTIVHKFQEFENGIWGNLNIQQISNFCKPPCFFIASKRLAPTHHEVSSNIRENLEHGLKIFQKTRNWMLAIWDHGNFEIWNQEPTSQETNKPKTKKPTTKQP